MYQYTTAQCQCLVPISGYHLAAIYTNYGVSLLRFTASTKLFQRTHGRHRRVAMDHGHLHLPPERYSLCRRRSMRRSRTQQMLKNTIV
ncbi:hypothetical protein Zmor_025019 [Zophobas morio]|uniref:Uncharacterized protein n=1 Tax=Zophobas morio TaxID=2755281 RepID=A0AA38M3P1_9CUCU|nr:hypothetical protein Zmor_025019 [Zophobas morio]